MNRTSLAGRRLAVYVVCTSTAIAIFFSSCKKEEDPVLPQNPPVSAAYQFPLTDGSYWVYQQERTDSTGNVIQVGATDSSYVEGDTTIGANTYKKIRTITAPGNQWFIQQQLVLVRDSAGYLVTPAGYFIEHDNFTDTLAYSNIGNGLVNAWYFMKHADSSVIVPAGTFLTIDYEGHMYATDPNYPHPVPRYTHQLYANGIGKIAEVLYFYSDPGYIQRRLISYHIQ